MGVGVPPPTSAGNAEFLVCGWHGASPELEVIGDTETVAGFPPATRATRPAKLWCGPLMRVAGLKTSARFVGRVARNCKLHPAASAPGMHEPSHDTPETNSACERGVSNGKRVTLQSSTPRNASCVAL